MATKIIPERKEITCDACGVVCDKKNRSVNGGVIVKADALDSQGAAVADASVKRDLCDACLETVRGAINAAAHGLGAGSVQIRAQDEMPFNQTMEAKKSGYDEGRKEAAAEIERLKATIEQMRQTARRTHCG